MKDNKNSFVCIGAIHIDYILQLQKKHFINRTNPITQKESLGGVAYNIALNLSFLKQSIELISLDCKKEIKKKILKDNIKFNPLTKKNFNRSYSSVLNKKGEMILGLANMDSYKKTKISKNIKLFKNTNIIFDLNLSSKIINFLIKKYSINNNICICGTSAHKVHKVNNLLSKINMIILNKQESLSLTNKKTIKGALFYLIKKNKKLTTIITNGKNKLMAYHNNIIYSCKPPQVIIRNENGAGDLMSAFFNYFIIYSEFKEALVKSMIAGSLQVSDYQANIKSYLQKIDLMSKKIMIKTKKI